MKLTTLLLIVGIMQVSATSLAQRVVLNEKNAPLAEVFEKISQQTGYDFVFTKSILSQAKPITLQFNGELGDALKKIFDNEPLEYLLSDKSVLVKAKAKNGTPGPDKANEAIAPIDVTGRVTDENNQPLVGATVKTKDNEIRTSTDLNGFFTLKGVQPGTTIVIIYIGYDNIEVPAAANIGQIKLKVATSNLDQVQIQAYGVTSKRLATGNIGTVTAKDIEKQPVSNPLLTLQGAIPGVIVTQSSGNAGTGVKIQIRGQNYVGTTSNDPLFVVDGVPYPAQLNNGSPNGFLSNILGSSGTGANGSPLSFINPDDIESISVLKDADATSIYGTRAANGAVLITTKKGKAGDAKVNVNLQNGFGRVSHFLPVMNTDQYLEMRREALRNDNLSPGMFDQDLNGAWDINQNHNFQKELIGRTAGYLDYTANISGGSNNIRYLVSGTYHRQSTVYPTNLADQRSSIHFNFGSTSTNQRFQLQFTGSYLVDNNYLPSVDLTDAAISYGPNAPILLTSDGLLNWGPIVNGFNTNSGNPLVPLFQPYHLSTNNLISNVTLSYAISTDFSFKANLGYNKLMSDENLQYPLSSQPEAYRQYYLNSAKFETQDLHSWIVEPQISYNHEIGKGKLQFLVGGTVNQQFTNGTVINASGQNSEQVLLNLSAATSTTVTSLPISTYKYASLFGRLNFNLADKYILSASVRRDGSSRFGPKNRYADFWSGAAAWLFSEEKIVKENLSWLSLGKIRASYGTTGSDQIGDYRYLNLYAIQTYPSPYQGIASLYPSALTNPALQWNITHKLEAALLLGFLNDRINFEASFFQNRSSNQFGNYALPIITGYTGITKNLPILTEQKGWELNLTTVNLKNSVFSWKTSANISFIRNKLLAYPNNPNAVIGLSAFGISPKFHYLGVDQATGLYQFSDGKGGITTTPETDPGLTQKTLVDENPQFYGGLQNSFTYKQFSLDVLLQFNKQKAANMYFGYIGSSPPGSPVNEPIWVLNRWQKPGDVSKYAAYHSDYSTSNNFADAQASDAAIGDASFIRFKNVALRFQLPAKWVQSVHADNISVYVNAQNLFTITNYLGLDPETRGTGLPPLRIITFGAKVTL